MAQDPAQERALWAPSVVFMDDIEPFDPKSGLYEWVRGPQAEPARVLVASWGRGPVAGVKPGSVAQSLLGGRSQGREHFAFTERKPKPEWPDLGPEATWLQGGLGLCPEHTDALIGSLASGWFFSKPQCALLKNGLVTAALPLAFWWNRKGAGTKVGRFEVYCVFPACLWPFASRAGECS